MTYETDKFNFWREVEIFQVYLFQQHRKPFSSLCLRVQQANPLLRSHASHHEGWRKFYGAHTYYLSIIIKSIFFEKQKMLCFIFIQVTCPFQPCRVQHVAIERHQQWSRDGHKKSSIKYSSSPADGYDELLHAMPFKTPTLPFWEFFLHIGSLLSMFLVNQLSGMDGWIGESGRNWLTSGGLREMDISSPPLHLQLEIDWLGN